MSSHGAGESCAEGRLSSTLREVWHCGLPLAERRMLCRIAVSSAMLARAPAQSPHAGPVYDMYEQMLGAVGRAAGLQARPGISQAKRILVEQLFPNNLVGKRLASRLGKYSKARNTNVHEASGITLLRELQEHLKVVDQEVVAKQEVEPEAEAVEFVATLVPDTSGEESVLAEQMVGLSESNADTEATVDDSDEKLKPKFVDGAAARCFSGKGSGIKMKKVKEEEASEGMMVGLRESNEHKQRQHNPEESEYLNLLKKQARAIADAKAKCGTLSPEEAEYVEQMTGWCGTKEKEKDKKVYSHGKKHSRDWSGRRRHGLSGTAVVGPNSQVRQQRRSPFGERLLPRLAHPLHGVHCLGCSCGALSPAAVGSHLPGAASMLALSWCEAVPSCSQPPAGAGAPAHSSDVQVES